MLEGEFGADFFVKDYSKQELSMDARPLFLTVLPGWSCGPEPENYLEFLNSDPAFEPFRPGGEKCEPWVEEVRVEFLFFRVRFQIC